MAQAASLLGRFCPQGGKVGLIAGSLGLRDHRERLEGFRDVAAREFVSFWLRDGRVASYTYQEPQGYRTVTSPADGVLCRRRLPRASHLKCFTALVT